jgi:D-glycero-alpha-D-manno-heptose-7-phosphate kinase
MILTRSPLRISLGGGGTDLPSYYQQFSGFLIAAAIDKYVYVSLSRPFTDGIRLKYSEYEQVLNISEVKHPIIRESIRALNPKTLRLEITTIADLPAGTGLGSSGSFTTALLQALHVHYKNILQPGDLAELACHIEMEKLAQPIGKQDQYIAAYGGITTFKFNKDGTVETEPLKISRETLRDLEENLLLFFTGISRSASAILSDQVKKSNANDTSMIENLHFIKDLGYRSRDALLTGNTNLFGELMHEHWVHKRVRSKGISSDFINNAYEKAIANGAAGGKLVGAGGGGFLMFYANDKAKLKVAMKELGLEEVYFQFDFEGTKVILS